MKNKLLVTVFVILVLTFLFSQPSSGMEVEKCKECHEKVIPIPRDSLTKDCMVVCHSQHTDIGPTTRVPEKVHSVHVNIRQMSGKEVCLQCHKNSPMECQSCHNSHKDIDSSKIKILTTNGTLMSVTICTNCHGGLGQPKGHGNFRNALSDSKHKWMSCGTCHLNVYGNVGNKANSYNSSFEFKLNFKDLVVMPISDSINLCKICHSSKYKELQEGTHGEQNKTCVGCHNPHTTKLGTMVRIAPKETQGNISTSVNSTVSWITEKVPILKNTTAIIILIIIILATIAEYLLSKDEEGKKTAYHTIKVRNNEETLRTLEIKLKDQNIGVVNDMLEANGVDILGMTMTKEEEDKGVNIRKYVIFANVEKLTDENVLISKIADMDNVKSAILTEKYEL